MTARRRDKALTLVAAVARVGKDLFDNMTAPIPNPPAAPTAAELRANRPALIEQLKAVATQLAEAQAAYESDLSASDPNDEKAIQALALSEQRIKVCSRRRAEVEQQLAALESATKVAERAELDERMQDIDAELADNRRAIELAAAAAKAAAHLVDALLEIRAHNLHHDKLRTEQQGIRGQLGRELVPTAFQSVEAQWILLAEGLRAHAQRESDPVRRGYLISLSLGHINFLPQTA
jgi:hypothetical protein